MPHGVEGVKFPACGNHQLSLRPDLSGLGATYQWRQLRGENGRDRSHRSRLFAAVRQLDSQNTGTPLRRQ